MKTSKANLSDLSYSEKNVRRHPAKQIEEMEKSIRMFGQIRPVIVDEQNTILAGNGMVEALRNMEKSTVNVLRMDNLSDKDKKKLMIADNRIYGLGFDHQENIFELLKEIDDFDVPGYDENVLESLLADDEDIEEDLNEYGNLTDEETREFHEAGERLQEQAANNPYQEPVTGQQESHQSPLPAQDQVATVDATPPKEGQKPCPHCGGTGWL